MLQHVTQSGRHSGRRWKKLEEDGRRWKKLVEVGRSWKKLEEDDGKK